jgi:hypothetical protein
MLCLCPEVLLSYHTAGLRNSSNTTNASCASDHHIMSSGAPPCPAVPGFGYIIIPHPHEAIFKVLGKYHTVSFFPEAHIPDPIEDTKICLWLGPGISPLSITVPIHTWLIPCPFCKDQSAPIFSPILFTQVDSKVFLALAPRTHIQSYPVFHAIKSLCQARCHAVFADRGTFSNHQ